MERKNGLWKMPLVLEIQECLINGLWPNKGWVSLRPAHQKLSHPINRLIPGFGHCLVCKGGPFKRRTETAGVMGIAKVSKRAPSASVLRSLAIKAVLLSEASYSSQKLQSLLKVSGRSPQHIPKCPSLNKFVSNNTLLKRCSPYCRVQH